MELLIVLLPPIGRKLDGKPMADQDHRTNHSINVDEKGMIKREEIEMCIREVMEGERGNELKRNAVRWKEFAKEAVDEGGSSDKHIEEFISELA
ncbi:hypothetical protein RJ639_015020 [Escallonia herrerae]|uniref:Uncharacterized protein n=1 Tax=Escallonia herrerae TaxID=1293975 RepID=A0AA89AMG7_9ASTE|nr:hypothetical protein RJ639_015020 [Escallonia herrerae]